MLQTTYHRGYRCVWLAFVLLNTLIFIKAGLYRGGHLQGSDGQWYYAMARSMVIDRDWDFANEMAATPYPEQIGKDAFRLSATGRVVNRYPVGFALLATPAFAVTHCLVSACTALGISGAVADGYSWPYVWGVGLFQVLFASASAFLLWRVLSRSLGPHPALIAVLLGWFGSNVFYYTAIQPFSPHAFGFSLVACLWYLLERDREDRSWSSIGFVCGILFVLRPTNLLMALCLLCHHSLFREWIHSRRRALYLALGSLPPLLVQMIYWKCVFGQWVVYSYGPYGFLWHEPMLVSTLFSSNHGLLFWHPLALVGIVGLAMAGHGCRSLLPGICLLWYANSCWCGWWFGHAFGARAFIEIWPMLIFGVGAVLARVRWKRVLHVALSLMLAWNLGLAGLYVLGQLPYEGEFSLLSRIGYMLGGDEAQLEPARVPPVRNLKR